MHGEGGVILRERGQKPDRRAQSPTPSGRLFVGYRALDTTYGPTEMHERIVAAGRSELADVQNRLNELAEQVVPPLQRKVRAAGAPPIEHGRE